MIVENPTDFINHNDISRDFTIETNFRSDAQIYTIIISSTISVFDDFTLKNKTDHSVKEELTVKVIDPCLDALIPDIIIPDLEIKVHEGPSVESIS